MKLMAPKVTLFLFAALGLFAQTTVIAKRQPPSADSQFSDAMKALRAASAAEDVVHDELFGLQREFEQEFLDKKVTRPTLEAVVRKRAEMEKVEASLAKVILTAKDLLKGSIPPGVSQQEWNRGKLSVENLEGASGMLRIGVSLDEDDFREVWKQVFHENLQKILPPFSELVKKFDAKSAPPPDRRQATISIAPLCGRGPGPPAVLGVLLFLIGFA